MCIWVPQWSVGQGSVRVVVLGVGGSAPSGKTMMGGCSSQGPCAFERSASLLTRPSPLAARSFLASSLRSTPAKPHSLISRPNTGCGGSEARRRRAGVRRASASGTQHDTMCPGTGRAASGAAMAWQGRRCIKGGVDMARPACDVGAGDGEVGAQHGTSKEDVQVADMVSHHDGRQSLCMSTG